MFMQLLLEIILLTFAWLVELGSLGIEIADKFLTNFHGVKLRSKSVNQEKTYGSSFWKTSIRIENTDIPYGRGHEDVCNQIFYR